jgi:hypothetical protein
MQAHINFVFPKISRPQSSGTSWELFPPSQSLPGDQGIHFFGAKPHFFLAQLKIGQMPVFVKNPHFHWKVPSHLLPLSRPITGLLTLLSL